MCSLPYQCCSDNKTNLNGTTSFLSIKQNIIINLNFFNEICHVMKYDALLTGFMRFTEMLLHK